MGVAQKLRFCMSGSGYCSCRVAVGRLCTRNDWAQIPAGHAGNCIGCRWYCCSRGSSGRRTLTCLAGWQKPLPTGATSTCSTLMPTWRASPLHWQTHPASTCWRSTWCMMMQNPQTYAAVGLCAEHHPLGTLHAAEPDKWNCNRWLYSVALAFGGSGVYIESQFLTDSRFPTCSVACLVCQMR